MTTKLVSSRLLLWSCISRLKYHVAIVINFVADIAQRGCAVRTYENFPRIFNLIPSKNKVVDVCLRFRPYGGVDVVQELQVRHEPLKEAPISSEIR